MGRNKLFEGGTVCNNTVIGLGSLEIGLDWLFVMLYDVKNVKDKMPKAS